jgi:hypothetical protein
LEKNRDDRMSLIWLKTNIGNIVSAGDSEKRHFLSPQEGQMPEAIQDHTSISGASMPMTTGRVRWRWPERNNT